MATKRKAIGTSAKKPKSSAATSAAPKAKKTSAAKGQAKAAAKAPARRGARKAGASTSSTAAEDRARSLALAIASAALDNKAGNVEIIDVRGKVDYSDYVVVMSGRSDRQVNALGRLIQEELEKNHKARCLGIEGMPQGSWLLMDYGDVIVHIFHEDARGYYDLETLWMDASRVPVES